MISFVSLGPGDPELITLQALRCLQAADCIYAPVPVSAKGRHSSKAEEMMLALDIRPEQIQLYDLPMSKQREGACAAYSQLAEELIRRERSEPGRSLIVVAEGDSGFYSSSAYISEQVEAAGLAVRQLCGVPAFIACNALAGGQLVQLEEQCRVIPGEATEAEWQEAWGSIHTIVVMKGSLCEAEIKRAVAAHPERRWQYFEFVGMPKEYVTERPEEILERSFPYFSIIISKRR
nr:precorrin-2 C(20)-methyltransferase [uncultured Porphyromonas sp.]